MIITFTPMRKETRLELHKIGDTLVFNGVSLDFSEIPEGATLPQSAIDLEWIASGVERIDGALHVTVIVPHGVNAPEETLFPQGMTVLEDGKIEIPAYGQNKEGAGA